MLCDDQMREDLRVRTLKGGLASETAESLVITEDFTAVGWVLTVKDVAERIQKEEPPFFIMGHNGIVVGARGSPSVHALGELLLRLIVCAPKYVKKHFPYHDLHPSVDLFMMMLSKRGELRHALLNYGAYTSKESMAVCDDLNKFSEEFKANLSDSKFKEKCCRAARKAVRTYLDLKRYVDRIFSLCSRVLVVRVDFYYSSDYKEGELSGLTVDRFKVDQDRSRFLSEFRRSAYSKACLGYCWKVEYALRKGWHFHWLFFFDGARVRQDVTLGKLIGEMWKVVAGDGASYWNCNAWKGNYALPGVGMIGHSDSRLRAGLDRAISYLTKPDFVLALSEGGGGRTLGKGMIRRRLTRRGRRRNGVLPGKS